MGKNLLKFLVFTTLGCAILYYIYHAQQKSYLEDCMLKGLPEEQCSLWNKLKVDFSDLYFRYVFLTILIYLASNFFRAKRWEMLLEPLGVKAKTSNTFGAVLIGYLANLALPRAGEIARASALVRNEDISFDKAFGTVVTDRLVDMVCLILLAIVTFLCAFDTIFGYFQKNFDQNAKLSFFADHIGFILVLIAVFITAVFMLFKYKSLFYKSALCQKIIQFFRGLFEGLMSITRLKSPMLFILYSLLTWVAYFLMVYVIFKAYPPTAHLGLTAGIVVFFFGTLGIIFPSPGGMGSYHFLIMEGLSLYQIDKTNGFLFANLIFFTIQILTTVVIGGLAFLWMQKTKNKRIVY